jgi:hypothetical protein
MNQARAMNQAVSDISSFVVSESGVFPSIKQFDELAKANQQAIEQEMKQVKDNVRPVVRKLLDGAVDRVDAVKEIRNILHGEIKEEKLSEVLEHALNEYPELMAGGKRKTRRGKRRATKRSTRGVRGGAAAPKRSTRRSKRGSRQGAQQHQRKSLGVRSEAARPTRSVS